MDLHGGSKKKKAKQNKTESNKDEKKEGGVSVHAVYWQVKIRTTVIALEDEND